MKVSFCAIHVTSDSHLENFNILHLAGAAPLTALDWCNTNGAKFYVDRCWTKHLLRLLF